MNIFSPRRRQGSSGLKTVAEVETSTNTQPSLKVIEASTFGAFDKRGWLQKQTNSFYRNTEHARWFVLSARNLTLKYYKSPHDAKERGYIKLRGCQVQESKSSRMAKRGYFRIVGERVLMVKAADQLEKEEWMSAIQRCIDDAERRSRRGGSSGSLGRTSGHRTASSLGLPGAVFADRSTTKDFLSPKFPSQESSVSRMGAFTSRKPGASVSTTGIMTPSTTGMYEASRLSGFSQTRAETSMNSSRRAFLGSPQALLLSSPDLARRVEVEAEQSSLSKAAGLQESLSRWRTNRLALEGLDSNLDASILVHRSNLSHNQTQNVTSVAVHDSQNALVFASTEQPPPRPFEKPRRSSLPDELPSHHDPNSNIPAWVTGSQVPAERLGLLIGFTFFYIPSDLEQKGAQKGSRTAHTPSSSSQGSLPPPPPRRRPKAPSRTPVVRSMYAKDLHSAITRMMWIGSTLFIGTREGDLISFTVTPHVVFGDQVPLYKLFKAGMGRCLTDTVRLIAPQGQENPQTSSDPRNLAHAAEQSEEFGVSWWNPGMKDSAAPTPPDAPEDAVGKSFVKPQSLRRFPPLHLSQALHSQAPPSFYRKQADLGARRHSLSATAPPSSQETNLGAPAFGLVSTHPTAVMVWDDRSLGIRASLHYSQEIELHRPEVLQGVTRKSTVKASGFTAAHMSGNVLLAADFKGTLYGWDLTLPRNSDLISEFAQPTASPEGTDGSMDTPSSADGAGALAIPASPCRETHRRRRSSIPSMTVTPVKRGQGAHARQVNVATMHASSNTQLWFAGAHAGPIRDVKWSPLYPFWAATCGDDGCIRVWDFQGFLLHRRHAATNPSLPSPSPPSISLLAEFRLHTSLSVHSIDWSPSHAELLCSRASDGTIKIWNLALPPHFQLHELETVEGSIAGVVWSPRHVGSLVAVSASGRVADVLLARDIFTLMLDWQPGISTALAGTMRSPQALYMSLNSASAANAMEESVLSIHEGVLLGRLKLGVSDQPREALEVKSTDAPGSRFFTEPDESSTGLLHSRLFSEAREAIWQRDFSLGFDALAEALDEVWSGMRKLEAGETGGIQSNSSFPPSLSNWSVNRSGGMTLSSPLSENHTVAPCSSSHSSGLFPTAPTPQGVSESAGHHVEEMGPAGKQEEDADQSLLAGIPPDWNSPAKQQLFFQRSRLLSLVSPLMFENAVQCVSASHESTDSRRLRLIRQLRLPPHTLCRSFSDSLQTQRIQLHWLRKLLDQSIGQQNFHQLLNLEIPLCQAVRLGDDNPPPDILAQAFLPEKPPALPVDALNIDASNHGNPLFPVWLAGGTVSFAFQGSNDSQVRPRSRSRSITSMPTAPPSLAAASQSAGACETVAGRHWPLNYSLASRRPDGLIPLADPGQASSISASVRKVGGDFLLAVPSAEGRHPPKTPQQPQPGSNGKPPAATPGAVPDAAAKDSETLSEIRRDRLLRLGTTARQLVDGALLRRYFSVLLRHDHLAAFRVALRMGGVFQKSLDRFSVFGSAVRLLLSPTIYETSYHVSLQSQILDAQEQEKLRRGSGRVGKSFSNLLAFPGHPAIFRFSPPISTPLHSVDHTEKSAELESPKGSVALIQVLQREAIGHRAVQGIRAQQKLLRKVNQRAAREGSRGILSGNMHVAVGQPILAPKPPPNCGPPEFPHPADGPGSGEEGSAGIVGNAGGPSPPPEGLSHSGSGSRRNSLLQRFPSGVTVGGGDQGIISAQAKTLIQQITHDYQRAVEQIQLLYDLFTIIKDAERIQLSVQVPSTNVEATADAPLYNPYDEISLLCSVPTELSYLLVKSSIQASALSLSIPNHLGIPVALTMKQARMILSRAIMFGGVGGSENSPLYYRPKIQEDCISSLVPRLVLGSFLVLKLWDRFFVLASNLEQTLSRRSKEFALILRMSMMEMGFPLFRAHADDTLKQRRPPQENRRSLRDLTAVSLNMLCNCAYLPSPLEKFFQSQLVPTLIQRLYDALQESGKDSATYSGLHAELRGLWDKIRNSRLGAGHPTDSDDGSSRQHRALKPKSGPVIEHTSPVRSRELAIGPRADLLNQLVDSLTPSNR